MPASTAIKSGRKPTNTPTKPIWNRKRDLLYLIFFLIHITVMFRKPQSLHPIFPFNDHQTYNLPVIDLTPIYPAAIKPQFLTTLRTWYITTYRDQFFTRPPAWFNAYMWMEALYHLPLSVWAIGALLRGRRLLLPVHGFKVGYAHLGNSADDSLVPLHLLVYAVQTAVTTITCIADYLAWPISNAEKFGLGQLYVPYLALCRYNSNALW